MMYDVGTFKRTYPEWFSPVTFLDAIEGFAALILIFLILFLIPYLYIRFVETGLVLHVRSRLIPFIRSRLHLGKFIDLIDRVLKTEIFQYPKTRT
ncbi:Uncharacterised protein [uncultured archaeon]|nr:Uncharacterised protein [uncultured archaeon]